MVCDILRIPVDGNRPPPSAARAAYADEGNHNTSPTAFISCVAMCPWLVSVPGAWVRSHGDKAPRCIWPRGLQEAGAALMISCRAEAVATDTHAHACDCASLRMRINIVCASYAWHIMIMHPPAPFSKGSGPPFFVSRALMLGASVECVPKALNYKLELPR